MPPTPCIVGRLLPFGAGRVAAPHNAITGRELIGSARVVSCVCVFVECGSDLNMEMKWWCLFGGGTENQFLFGVQPFFFFNPRLKIEKEFLFGSLSNVPVVCMGSLV